MSAQTEQIVTALILLPIFYNPNPEGGEGKRIEDEKFEQTLTDVTNLAPGGGTLHYYPDGNVRGVWWDRGIVNRDVLAILELDFVDSPMSRATIETYVKQTLKPRFQQDEIYMKYIFPLERLVITDRKIE